MCGDLANRGLESQHPAFAEHPAGHGLAITHQQQASRDAGMRHQQTATGNLANYRNRQTRPRGILVSDKLQLQAVTTHHL